MTRSVFPAAATTDDWTISHNDRLEPWKLQRVSYYIFTYNNFPMFPHLSTLVHNCPHLPTIVHNAQMVFRSRPSVAMPFCPRILTPVLPNGVSALKPSDTHLANAPATCILPISSLPPAPQSYGILSQILYNIYKIYIPSIYHMGMY